MEFAFNSLFEQNVNINNRKLIIDLIYEIKIVVKKLVVFKIQN